MIERDKSLDIIISLIEAGVDTKQKAGFDLLKEVLENEILSANNVATIGYLIEKGLDPHFKSSTNYHSAFQRIIADGNLDILNFIITKNCSASFLKNIDFSTIAFNDKNFACLELLLNAGFMPDRSTINQIFLYYFSNPVLLQKMVHYNLFEKNAFMDSVLISFIKNNELEHLKILMASDFINFNTLNNFINEGMMPINFKIDNSLNDYIYIYQITQKIIADEDLNDSELIKFNELLTENKNCAEIFLGMVEQYILKNGYPHHDENLIAIFSDMREISDSNNDKFKDHLSARYFNAKSKPILDQLTNRANTGSLDILENKYNDALHNLEKILITEIEELLPVDYETLLSNPKFKQIALLMQKEQFTGDILAYLNSANFKLVNGALLNQANETLKISPAELKLIEFYQKNILGKADLHYLTEFFSDEHAVNNLTYVMQQIPGLLSSFTIFTKTKNLHPYDPFCSLIEQATKLYHTEPVFEIHKEQNAELAVTGEGALNL